MRLVPERTIDSLFAYEALQALPTGLIWSPANTETSTNREWDHHTWLRACDLRTRRSADDFMH